MNKQHPSKSKPQAGFTLLELLVVIVVISILMSLILPAISGVMRRARIAEVSAEFTQLDQALTTFKSKFGQHPPSSLTVPVAGSAWSPADRAKVKGIWPQFNFATNGGMSNTVAVHLNGAECLVFFLGGVNTGSAATPNLQGFSKNPLSPWTATGNPDGPFMEFDSGRLVDVDGDGVVEYLDALPGQTTPILYLSGAGSSMNKDNDAVADDFDVFTDAPLSFSFHASKNMSFPYTKPGGTVPYNKDTFQLISPGDDGLYGPGGYFEDGVDVGDLDLNGNSTILNADADSDGVFEVTDFIEARRVEADNITNFNGGTLNESCSGFATGFRRFNDDKSNEIFST